MERKLTIRVCCARFEFIVACGGADITVGDSKSVYSYEFCFIDSFIKAGQILIK